MAVSTTQLILTGVIVFASFAGGLVSVLIGQFLSFYRDQRSDIEELAQLIESVYYIDEIATPYTDSPEDVDQIISEMKRHYLSNRWWMDDELESDMGELIHDLVMFRDNLQRLKKYENMDPEDITEESGGNEAKLIKHYVRHYDSVNEQTKERIESISNQVISQYQRIPIRRFVPRFFGELSVDSDLSYGSTD
ncbi:hypothetical protein [Halorubrum tropicale]|uniref:hypothetical protein n=1 Tax=Halorubrum tropicale TaxID=1765655 RepID=UPI0011118BBF|nr:hypothetical protein [Halorubrum tropicale]